MIRIINTWDNLAGHTFMIIKTALFTKLQTLLDKLKILNNFPPKTKIEFYIFVYSSKGHAAKTMSISVM